MQRGIVMLEEVGTRPPNATSYKDILHNCIHLCANSLGQEPYLAAMVRSPQTFTCIRYLIVLCM